MKVKYKVVKRKSRMSAMVNGNSKYARRYIDGRDVYARHDTLGIMVFETLTAADDFISWWDIAPYQPHKDLIILRVLPIGRGKKVRRIAADVDTDVIDRFYRNVDNIIVGEAPDRTMAYPGVHVIGQYVWGE